MQLDSKPNHGIVDLSAKMKFLLDSDSVKKRKQLGFTKCSDFSFVAQPDLNEHSREIANLSKCNPKK